MRGIGGNEFYVIGGQAQTKTETVISLSLKVLAFGCAVSVLKPLTRVCFFISCDSWTQIFVFRCLASNIPNEMNGSKAGPAFCYYRPKKACP